MADRAELRDGDDGERPTVAICAGKDCRKRSGYVKMRKVLDQHGQVSDLKCVGLCKGPVVVASPDSENPVVYTRLRSKRDRRRFSDLLSGSTRARGELSDRVVTKKKVIASVVRQRRR